MNIIDRARAAQLRHHLRNAHGYAIHEGDDTDADGQPIDAWMQEAPLHALRDQHNDDHGNYAGGGGRHKHEHAQTV